MHQEATFCPDQKDIGKCRGLGCHFLHLCLGDFSRSYFPIGQRTFCFSWHLNFCFNGCGETLTECLLAGIVGMPYVNIDGITTCEQGKAAKKCWGQTKYQVLTPFLLLLLLHRGRRRAAWHNGFVFELVLGINKMFYLQHLQVCL